jgi:cobalamin synthase
MTRPRRARAEWDELAREPWMRHRREVGRAVLVVVTAAVVAFALAVVVLPSSANLWAFVVAFVAGAAAAAVLLRRAERTAKGWGGKPVAGRWIDQPGRTGRRD